MLRTHLPVKLAVGDYLRAGLSGMRNTEFIVLKQLQSPAIFPTRPICCCHLSLQCQLADTDHHTTPGRTRSYGQGPTAPQRVRDCLSHVRHTPEAVDQ
jgi:hypothetical protein